MPKKRDSGKRRLKKTRTSGDRRGMEQLEKEKKELMEKNKHLLEIIETISKSEEEPVPEKDEISAEDSDIEVPESGEEEPVSEKEESGPEEESPEEGEKPLFSLKKFEEKVKRRFEDNKSRENIKKDISKIIKERVDSKVSKLSEDLKKISELEDKINKIADRLGAPQTVPAPALISPEAYEASAQPVGAVSKGLAAFGEEVDLQTELMEIKRDLKELNKNLENLKKKTDYSITGITDRIKILDKIPVLEENFQTISDKLGPDNVQKMRKLIFSADELVDEVIPDLLNKRMRARMEPAINEIRNLKHGISEVRAALNNIRTEIIHLQKTKDDIKALELEKDRLYKEIITRDVKFREGLDILKGNIKKKMDEMDEELSERLDQTGIENHEKIEKDINKIFSEVIKLKLAEVDKNYLELSERMKKLALADENLGKRITELKAPEGVKKWVGSQLKAIEESTIPEIKSIRKEILSQTEQIKSLREEMKTLDKFSFDISKATESHRERIEKLVSEEDSLGEMLDDLKSEIKIMGEKIQMEREKVKGLESEIRAREKEFGTTLDKQKSDMAAFRLELVKMLENSTKAMKKELEEERMEDIKNQTEEIRSDILRIQGIKGELEDYKKKQEARLERIVSEVKDTIPDIRLLGGKVEGLETLAKRLEKEKINEAEFSSIVKLLTKRMGEVEDHFDEIEESISEDKSRIEKAVNDLLSDDRIMKTAQELIGKDLEGKIQNTTKSLSSDIAELQQRLKESSGTVSYLKEKYNVLESLTRGVPKRLESQEILINKMMESKDSLAKKTDTLAAELKSMSGRMSADKDRLTGLEQRVSLKEREAESRISSLSDSLSKANEGIISEIDEMKSKLEGIASLATSVSSKSINEQEFVSTVKSISKRIDEIEDLYTKLDKQSSLDKTKLQSAINQALSDDKVLRSAQDSLGRWMEEKVQVLWQRVASDMEKLSAQLKDKSDSLTGKFYTDMEKLSQQMAEHSKSISSMRERMSALASISKQSEEQENKISRLKEKVNVLGSLSRDLPKRFDQQASELKNLMGSSGFFSKRIDSLDSGLKNINEKFDSDTERLTAVEKEFKSNSRSQERRLDDADKRVSAMQGSLQGSSKEMAVLKERLDDLEKRFEQSVRMSMEEKKTLKEELKKQGDRVGRILRELSE